LLDSLLQEILCINKMFNGPGTIRRRISVASGNSTELHKDKEIEETILNNVVNQKCPSWFERICVVKLSFVLACSISYTIGSNFGLLSLDIAQGIRGYAWNYDKGCVISDRDQGGKLCWHINTCDYCMAVKGPITVNASDLTKELFQKYDVEKQPLLVKRVFNNGDDFNLDWLRDTYLSDEEALIQQKNKSSACSYYVNFFTKEEIFPDLETMLRAPPNDTKFENPWYIGWRVCQAQIEEKLAKLIKRPNFFQDDVYVYGVPHIYIGTPGLGVQDFHIDKHDTSSYQLQMSGRKRWMLKAPSECSSPLLCGSSIMEIDIEQGDALFVDSSYWQHSTKVLGDSLSQVVIFDYDFWTQCKL